MGAIERSWRITKLSFSVIAQDKEMLLFPLLASIASALYAVLLIFPSGLISTLQSAADDQVVLGMAEYLILFVIYLGLAFIATFFNVCVVYTTKTRFEGGDATFADSIKFATSKIGIIFQWSLVSATVGVLLAMLDRLAERLGGVGEILMKIVGALLGAVWSIITIFVVPTLVYEDVSPTQAIKISATVIKETWGESLVRHFGLGLMRFAALVAVIFATIALASVVPSGTAKLVVIAGGMLAGLVTILVFNVANTVFNTSLYVYARTGKEPAGFRGDGDVIANAFRAK